MKNLSFIFIVCLLHIATCQVIHAQKKAPLIANWEVGDTYTFEVSKKEIYSNAFEASWNNTQEYVSTFEVIEKDSLGYTIKWVRHLDLAKYHIPEELHTGFSDYETFEVIYKTGPQGRFVTIVNWEELQKKKSQMYDDGLALLKKQKNKIKNAFLHAYRADSEDFSDLEGIHKKAFGELLHFHYLYGLEYPVHEKIDFHINDKIYRNYDPIFMDVSLYVSEMNEDYFVISKDVVVDEDSEREFLNQLFNSVQLPHDKEKSKGSLDFERNVVHQFDYKKSIPNRIEAIERIVISDTKYVDSDSYELISLKRIDNNLN